jgi:hypothetical protein
MKSNLVEVLVATIMMLFATANSGAIQVELQGPTNHQKLQKAWAKPPSEKGPVDRVVAEKRAAMAVQKIQKKGAEAVSRDFADGVYYVVEGDCLYNLSDEFLKSREWEILQEENPFLKNKNRIVRKGEQTVVLLYPGEELRGLTESIEVKNNPQEITPPIATTVVTEETNPWLSKIVSIAGIAAVITVALSMMIWLLYNYRKIRKSSVASAGSPMRNRFAMYTGIPVTNRELITTSNRLHDIQRNGGQLNVIYKATLSCKKIPVEYGSGETKKLVFREEPVYMGVFVKNKKITDVVIFHGYCLNGIFFNEMDATQLKEAVKTFEFGDHATVVFTNQSEYKPSYQAATDWLQDTYGKEQETGKEEVIITVADQKPPTKPPVYRFDKEKGVLSLEVGDAKLSLTRCTGATVEEMGENVLNVTAHIGNTAIGIVANECGISLTPKTQERKTARQEKSNVIKMEKEKNAG